MSFKRELIKEKKSKSLKGIVKSKQIIEIKIRKSPTKVRDDAYNPSHAIERDPFSKLFKKFTDTS